LLASVGRRRCLLKPEHVEKLLFLSLAAAVILSLFVVVIATS